MRPAALLLTLGLCSPVVGPAAANAATAEETQFLSGNQLHTVCADGQADNQACLSYVLGVIDAMAVYDEPMLCLPDRATRGQMADVVAKWLELHPAVRHLQGASLVRGALLETFPCPAR